MNFTGKDVPKCDFIRLTHNPFDDNTFAWDQQILYEVLSKKHPDVVVQTEAGFCNLTEMVRHFKTRSEKFHQQTIDVINELCTCGGKGPQDKGVCNACMIWHRMCGRVK